MRRAGRASAVERDHRRVQRGKGHRGHVAFGAGHGLRGRGRGRGHQRRLEGRHGRGGRRRSPPPIRACGSSSRRTPAKARRCGAASNSPGTICSCSWTRTRFSSATRCGISSRRSPTRRWARSRAMRGSGTLRSFIARCQALEYICGFNLDRRAYDAWDCITVAPGAISAVGREALRRGGRFPSGHAGGGYRPDAEPAPARLPHPLHGRRRGVDGSARNHPRAGQATLPLVFRHDAMPLETSRHALQSASSGRWDFSACRACGFSRSSSSR